MVSKLKVIEVKVTDPLRGGVSHLAGGRRFMAVERAPTIYRVNDGTFDFTFTTTDLENKDWIDYA